MREFVVLVTNRFGWRVYIKAFGRRWAFGPNDNIDDQMGARDE